MLATCTACGQPVASSAAFCVGCGQPVQRACAQCGGPLSAGAQFCGTCGADVAAPAVASAVAPAAAPIPPIPAPAVPPAPSGVPQSGGVRADLMRTARRRPLLVAAGTLAVVAVFVATIMLGNALTKGTPASTGPAGSAEPSYPAIVTPPLVELKPLASTSVADGAKVTDANGVTVAIAKGAVVGAAAVHLAASDLPASFDSSVLSEDGWKRMSPAYSLELDKDSDVIGNVPLSFPSTSPDDRVAVLIDSRYLLVLGVEPVNGRLTVQASTESATNPAFEGEGNHYFVVTKAGTAAAPDAIAMANIAPAPAPAVTPTCTPGSHPTSTTCWNPAHSISFTAATTLDADWEARVGVFFGRIEAIMKKYGLGAGNLGFKNAHPTTADPIHIVIDSTPDMDPRYDPGVLPGCSTIYVGFRTVYNIDDAGEQQLMAHELFHWVQHHAYPMRLDGNNPAKYWHDETQAETASFLVDPAYQPARLLKVASQLQVEGTSGVLGWQKPAGDWEHGTVHVEPDPSRYVQGQVVSLGICDGPTCIESRKDLIGEVDGGYRNYSIVSYHWGLENTARYLLGTAPKGVTVDLTAPILQTGRGIGDYIHINQKPGVHLDYAVIDTPTNLTKTPASGEVAIHAAIAANGLYPIRVSNGSDVPLDSNCLPGSNQFTGNELKPNAPYLIHLEAGVELYWRIGDGPVQHSDGSKATDIGPVTSEPSVAFQAADLSWTTKPGIASVRIVAVNSTKDAATLIGNVAPQAPKTVASPSKVDKPDPNTPVQLRVDMTQVALNFAGATAEWDFGDGSPTEPAKITPDAKMQASITTTHTFKTTSSGVRVTFRDSAGKALAWDPVNIAVGAAGGGHWVLASTVPSVPPVTKTNTDGSTKYTLASANGRITASYDSVYENKPVHRQGSASWGLPPASAAPGEKWTATLSASYSDSSIKSCTGSDADVGADVSVKATWWADYETPKEDDFDITATCRNGSGSKQLSWVFPAHVDGTCGIDSACDVDISVAAQAGLEDSDDVWTYHYQWQP